jgi:uncharacterized small protein (DUF1192 family)
METGEHKDSMSDAQIQELDRRLTALTQEVNNLKAQMGVVGTSQAAIAQIYTRLDTFAEATNANFEQVSRRFERIERTQVVHSAQLNDLQVGVAQILEILRDHNGGSGL